jgi:hypothetical protein
MPSLRHSLRVSFASVALAAAALAGVTARAAEEVTRDAPPPVRLRDLDYGDVLFHFFQDDYFDSIVRLEANREWGRMQPHAADAELLAGGLYLSLGLQDEATRIFEGLLAGPVAPSVRDRAWFYLARVAYQRGQHDVALRNLGHLGGPLPGKLEPERRVLEANVLMALGRYDEAATRLSGWTDASGWADYARFNLGVALLRSGQASRGRALLEQVGTLPATREEQASLRDRANLALGFALLQEQGADAAVTALSRVRLDGPYTNRALLALGWAQSNAKRPAQALVPWLELRERKLLDASVQESMLAVPYAYVQLASNGQAAQQYRQAVDAYAAESRRLAESIAAIHGGGFLDAILEASPSDAGAGWFWQLEKLPDAPHTRYVYHLLASHEFQEGLKNYRDLRLMQANLGRWAESLEAFDAMVEAREQVAATREPRRTDALASTDLQVLEQRLDEVRQRFAAAEAGRDVLAFSSDQERTQWQALDAAEARVAALPQGAQRDEQAERVRLLRGVLLWQLDRDYKLRAANARRGLEQAGASIDETRARLALIEGAGELVPRDTAGFAERVAELRERVNRIQPQVDATAVAQEAVLANLAVTELQAQQRRLADYATQAQFALATLYDAAATGAAR